MSEIIRPGAALLFMKVGSHAQESLDVILKRKNDEIAATGRAMWGYGGNTCHPRTMVQPFAEEQAERGNPIYLCMEEMESSHWADPDIAAEYSADGITWHEIEDDIKVKGSRFALVINKLHRENFQLHLDQTRVAIGLNKGRIGSRYISGRVDKACLEVTDARELSNSPDRKEVRIDLVAELLPPYAVFLRGSR